MDAGRGAMKRILGRVRLAGYRASKGFSYRVLSRYIAKRYKAKISHMTLRNLEKAKYDFSNKTGPPVAALLGLNRRDWSRLCDPDFHTREKAI